MPKYLVHSSYTAEGARGLLKSGGTARRRAVEELLASLGGKLEAFYFTFGDEDAILIMIFPISRRLGHRFGRERLGFDADEVDRPHNSRRGRRGDQQARQVPPTGGVRVDTAINNGRGAAALGFPQTRATLRRRGISNRIIRCYPQGMKKA